MDSNHQTGSFSNKQIVQRLGLRLSHVQCPYFKINYTRLARVRFLHFLNAAVGRWAIKVLHPTTGIEKVVN